MYCGREAAWRHSRFRRQVTSVTEFLELPGGDPSHGGIVLDEENVFVAADDAPRRHDGDRLVLLSVRYGMYRLSSCRGLVAAAILMCPPDCLMKPNTRLRPRPLCPCFQRILVVKNGSKMRTLTSGGMPVPVSVTSKSL